MLPSPTHPKLDLHGDNLTYYPLTCYLLILTSTTLRKAESNHSWRPCAVLGFATQMAAASAWCHFYSRYGGAPHRTELRRGWFPSGVFVRTRMRRVARMWRARASLEQNCALASARCNFCASDARVRVCMMRPCTLSTARF